MRQHNNPVHWMRLRRHARGNAWTVQRKRGTAKTYTCLTGHRALVVFMYMTEYHWTGIGGGMYIPPGRAGKDCCS